MPRDDTPTTRVSWFAVVWWSALAVLVVNDHILKDAGVLSEFVTGKLSDFAGLLVAPLLLVVALRLRRAASRLVVFGAVAFVFAAIKVSPAAAMLMERLTAAIGVPWTILVDPTDLLALLVLPVAWLMLTRASRLVFVPTLHRAGVVLGAAACVASGGPSSFSTAAWVVNRTDRQIEVRIRSLDASLDCDAIASRETRALSAEAFGGALTFDLGPSNVLPLERRPELDEFDGFRAAQVFGRCDAALVQISRGPWKLVFWNGLEPVIVPTSLEEEEPEFSTAGMIEVSIDEDDNTTKIAPGSGLLYADIVDEPEPSTCPMALFDRFEWSTFPRNWDGLLVDVQVADDGCLALQIEDYDDPLYLCIPPAEFPFAPGQSIRIEGPEGLSELFIESTESPIVRLGVWSAVSTISSKMLNGEVVSLDCAGDRLDCGSYAVPASLELRTGNRVVAGSAVDLPNFGEPERVRVVVGRAEHVIVGSADCQPSRANAGLAADVLVVREEIE